MGSRAQAKTGSVPPVVSDPGVLKGLATQHSFDPPSGDDQTVLGRMTRLRLGDRVTPTNLKYHPNAPITREGLGNGRANLRTPSDHLALRFRNGTNIGTLRRYSW